jgi:hypothetical protein
MDEWIRIRAEKSDENSLGVLRNEDWDRERGRDKDESRRKA